MEEPSKGDSCLLKEDTYSMLLQRTELEPTDGSYRVPDSVQYEKENKKQKTNKIKNQKKAQHLLILHRTWVQFPTPSQWIATIYNSSARRPDTLFWLPQLPDAHYSSKTHIHKK